MVWIENSVKNKSFCEYFWEYNISSTKIIGLICISDMF